MADFRFVINDPKTGKSYQKEMEKKTVSGLAGLKIGGEFDGGLIGLPGYKLELRGGSDADGFSMRKDMHGTRRKRTFVSQGPGYRPKDNVRRRKMIRGNTFGDDLAQINVKVVKAGPKKLEELFGAAPAEGEAKAEAPAEEKKE